MIKMGLYDFTVYDVIKRNAQIFGNRVAFIFGDQRITYRQYLEKVDRVASGLLSAGLEKGDRIAVLAQNSLEFVYLYGAAARVGAIMLPLNWRSSPEELEYVISDGSPKVLFVDSPFHTTMAAIIPKFDFIKEKYSLGHAEEDFAGFENLLVEPDMVIQWPEVYSDDGYVIIHTAAVSGRPKGAVLTHQGIIASNALFMYYWNLSNADINILLLPLFHMASLGSALSVMQAGGVNIILPKFDVDLAVRIIQEEKVSVFCEFSPMLTKMLDEAKQGGFDLSSLRIVGGLDSPDAVKRLEESTNATFWIGYGQSETSGIISFAPYLERLGSAGLPAFLCDVQIMDDHGNILKKGESGEIVIRGPLVFKGYWNRDDDNEYTFRNGWHHTGDTGHLDADGYLWYSGRKMEKELIKTGGENVYPAEVEKAILEHPLIEEAVVIGVPDSQWGEAIKGICVLKKGKSLDPEELIEFVGSRIARFKKPKFVVFASSLPKTAGGETDRNEVKALYGSG